MGDGDPVGRDGHAPQAFATGYERQAGEALVFGGVGVALIGVLAAVVRGDPGLLVISAAGLMSTWYFYPLVERGRPVLGGNDEGLFIDGIGFIAWDAVAGLKRLDRAVRSIRTVTLTIELNRPLAEAIVRPASAPIWRQFMTRIWKERANAVELQLHTLRMSPDQIIGRLSAFLPQARR